MYCLFKSQEKKSYMYYLNFHPLEIESHYHDPQLQVSKNNPYLFNLRPNINKPWTLSPRIYDVINCLSAKLIIFLTKKSN